MRAKFFTIVLFVVLALGLPGASVLAQDEESEPEPVVVVDPVEQVTEDIDAGAVRLSEALGWLIVFFGVIQAHGMAVSAFLEETVKPVLKKMVETDKLPIFGDYGKVLILGAAAFGFGVWENTSGNVNLLTGTPFPYFDQAGHIEMAALHGGLSVMGAFIGHRSWEIIGSYAKRAKAALDAFVPSSPPMPTSS